MKHVIKNIYRTIFPPTVYIFSWQTNPYSPFSEITYVFRYNDYRTIFYTEEDARQYVYDFMPGVHISYLNPIYITI